MASRPISPVEPAKKHPPPIQPNAHPYAIKTTSSALLSRSTSSPHSAHHTRHHYVPPPPSRIPIGKVWHRHSSSLSSVEGYMRDVNEACTVPAPLPTPPPVVASQNIPSVALKDADQPKLTHRVRRAETMPSRATEPITNHNDDQRRKFGRDQDCRQDLYAGLPLNPKQWNTDELTTYLEASFELEDSTNGEDSSLLNILECVRTRGLTGRELLRLTDTDLAGTPLSDVQRAQLLERSRTLRADVLRGRIYVDSYHSHEVSDNSNDIYSQSIRGAAASADDLRLLFDNKTGKDDGILPPSPTVSLHRSNSVSDATAQRYRDLARMRMRRRGRVKGLVETWERTSISGSECSASEESSLTESEAESEDGVDGELGSISNDKCSPESPAELPSILPDESDYYAHSSAMDSAAVPQEPALSTPPPPYTHVYTVSRVVEDQEEEPSIEELLASTSGIPLKGARAWEADISLGETVKRVPVSLSVDASNSPPSVTEPDASRPPENVQQVKCDSVGSKGSIRRSTGSRGKDRKAQKRIVTAIFTGSPSHDVSEDEGDEMRSRIRRRRATDVDRVVRSEAQASSDLQSDHETVLRALEQSIAASRAQLEVFNLRLEKVEADTSRQEEVLIRAQFTDSHHSSDFESRQRRSEVTVETTETFGKKDPLEGMSLLDITRAIVTRAMGWLFPYEHLCLQEGQDDSQARSGPHSAPNDRYPSPAKRYNCLQLARMSCSIILVSFAICAAVLRRMGFGRWVRRP